MSVRIALPKGRFAHRSREVVEALGGTWGDGLRFSVQDGRIEAFLLRPADIPSCVARGYVDAGITPEEWVLEWETSNPAFERVLVLEPWVPARLAFYSSGRLWPPGASALIATCFPGVGRQLLADYKSLDIQWLTVTGSTEAFVGSVADYGLDCVETGKSLADNGLIELKVTHPSLRMIVIANSSGPNEDLEAFVSIASKL